MRYSETLKNASELVSSLKEYKTLTPAGLSIRQRLNIWKTYFSSKIIYPMMILNLTDKSTAKKVTSQISMAQKSCLGLNRNLSKEKMYGWLQELSPEERADITLLRLIKKLRIAGIELYNENKYLGNIKSIPDRLKVEFLTSETTLKEIKYKVIEEKGYKIGIKEGLAFEAIETRDDEWFRLVSEDIEIYRWKDKNCFNCNEKLSIDHVLQCKKQEYIREEIEKVSKREAVSVIKNPSLLNKLPKVLRQKAKAFVADQVSMMIRSAEEEEKLRP